MHVVKLHADFVPPFVMQFQATMAQSDPSGAPTLRALSFKEMINGTVADVVDADHDMLISKAEYGAQIAAAGGTRERADALYEKLDLNGDGRVSSFELRDSLADPTAGIDHAALVQGLLAQIHAGQSVDRPSGTVLNAQGEVADVAAVMRHVYAYSPGNVDVA